LRNDNADVRLTKLGYELGLASEASYRRVEAKQAGMQKALKELRQVRVRQDHGKMSLYELLARPEVKLPDLVREHDLDIPTGLIDAVELEAKYHGYFERQQREADRLRDKAGQPIPDDFDYEQVRGLRNEARKRLEEIQPTTLAQAGKVQGITPADLSILMIALHGYRHRGQSGRKAATITT
jgi:tRNA uridine 5-carboxymethylaminomethyl modification enzyme